jgi:two-component system response regulator HydG
MALKPGNVKDQDIEIVVIEDDVDVQDLLKAYFTPRGYSMTFFDNPMQLLDEAKKRNLYADVIITDLLLPELSGTDLIKKLRAWGLTLPIILITSKSSIQTAYEAIQAGAFDFIVKPLHLPQLEISLQRAVRFKEILHENISLREALKEKSDSFSDKVVAKSQGFRTALDLARRVAHSNANILVTGESGTGKEVIARTIHESGNRSSGPFIAINCAAIPETLLEAELFGYAKGSFTGAIDKKAGLFEEAEGGTLFLDEIGDLSQPLQAKLLRVLQDRKIKRIGENRFRDINVRIVAATHRNLKQEVHENRFREDLYFRLNVIPIHIPPLRDRPEDIVPLADFFLRRFSAMNASTAKRFSKETLAFLLKHQWSGNVRELENTVERAVVLCENEEINLADMLIESSVLPSESRNLLAESTFQPADDDSESMPTSGHQFLLDDIVKSHIIKILEFNKGAKDKTAKMLGIDRKTLYRKLNEYGY